MEIHFMNQNIPWKPITDYFDNSFHSIHPSLFFVVMVKQKHYLGTLRNLAEYP